MSSQGGVSIARNRNGDRFYNPPAVRRHKQQQQMLQQQQQKEEQIRKSSAEAASASSSSLSSKANWGGGSVESEKRSEHDDWASSSASEVGSVSRDGVDCLTNLDRFLEFTTPSVPAQYFPKTSIRDWRNHGAEFHPYFVLGDLWESFKEWSAYGAGVPLLMNGNDSVVQYYVPYLSGIQLYVDPSRPASRRSNRRPGEYSDAESSREISSNGSSDCEAERGANDALNEPWSKLNLTGADSLSYKRHSLRKEPIVAAFSSGEHEITNPPGLLTFEYLERDPPFGREPLADKISVLASQFPELRTYRSCDLLPSSWISVAWYPIYRIPTGPTLQNLDACFLTFHSLSTPLRSISSDFLHTHNSSIKDIHSADTMKLSLPIFGLAFYKFKISVWNPSGVCQKADSLLLAAENWLRLLQVNHPDYSFFVSHSSFASFWLQAVPTKPGRPDNWRTTPWNMFKTVVFEDMPY